jgi:drug/metabolite transporter (DMT)-like permease
MRLDIARNHIKSLLLLHILLFIYSFCGICSKTAGLSDFMSARFVACYAVMIVILGIYALAWQQIIKNLPLTTAYANKAVTIVWGIVWGYVFFGEGITPGKAAGAALIVIGIVLYATADNEDRKPAAGERLQKQPESE